MNYLAIIFDMDGVLIDSERIWAGCENTFLKSVASQFNEEDRKNLIGGSVKRFYVYLKNKYQISLTEKEFGQQYLQFGIDNIYTKIQPIKGVVDFLQMCQKKNIPLALASSSCYDWIDMAIDKLDLRKYFKFIVSAEDLDGKGKPAPDIFLKAASLLNVEPSQCLVFEDSHNGVLAGKSAGMDVYGIRNGVNDEQDFSQTDHIFNSFTELMDL